MNTHWQPSHKLQELIAVARATNVAMREAAARNARDTLDGHQADRTQYQKLYGEWCRAELEAERLFKQEMRAEP